MHARTGLQVMRARVHVGIDGVIVHRDALFLSGARQQRKAKQRQQREAYRPRTACTTACNIHRGKLQNSCHFYLMIIISEEMRNLQGANGPILKLCNDFCA